MAVCWSRERVKTETKTRPFGFFLGGGRGSVWAREATGGIVISGGLAVLCIGSLVVVILGVAFFVYQRGLGGGVMGGPGGRRNPYTLVMKQGDV